ncbi:MAG: DUF4292 domain-containing protein [Deltaproteobacteria bacterium]|nr:DUF4292 domain-containing protein [Deltaproteobacteria bacterium]
MRLKLIILCAAVIAALGGCHIRPAPIIELSGERVLGSEKRALTAALQQRASEMHSFRTLASVELRHGQESERFREVFVFERPAKLRVEILPLQAFYALALITARGGEVTILDMQERQAHRSPFTPAAIRRAIGVPATYDEIFGYLTARLPLEIFVDEATFEEQAEVRRAGANYVVSVLNGSLVAEIDPQNHLVRKLQLRDRFNEQLSLTAEYGALREVDGVPMYGDISLSLFDPQVDILLKLNAIAINREISDQLFEAEIPADFPVSNR